MAIIRKLLGPSRREVFERLAGEADAEFDPGGLLSGPKVRKRFDNWTVTLTASKSAGPSPGVNFHTTRLRVPFVSADGFRFTIERKSGLGKRGKPIGRHFVGSGRPDFDDEFWLKSRDEAKVRALLDDDGYRRRLLSHTTLWLTVRDKGGWFDPKFPEDVDLLAFEEIGMAPASDVHRLRSLFDVMGATLTRLCRIGSARRDDPGVVV